MARRTGVPSLLKVTQRLCYLITKFTPVIIFLYPENTALHAALAAAGQACSTLAAELAPVREWGD